MSEPRAPRVLMISPRFNPDSFWSFRDTCHLQGAKWLAPPLGLVTLAAMLPKSWPVRLIDRNVEELVDADIASADMVMTGGMLPQEPDLLDVMAMCERLGVPVCVGGPAPTSTPEHFAHANFLVVGEAESVIGDLIAAIERGDAKGRFTAPKFQADITTTPIPRFDLLTYKNYLWVNVQFSRGCPFTCEFCDIIELYGRVPRTKTTPQMLAELDHLHGLGYRGHVDFVDDNLIGNKKAIKLFLPHLIAWQKKHRYPYKFSTEASLNLADDAELLGMMRDAGFTALFTGIETPDEATLVQTQKKQNTKRSIADSVHRIFDAGMYVTAGFIVGFDQEKGSVAKAMIQCIRDTDIPPATIGLLTALPNTQLSRRLAKENRLYDDFRQSVTKAGDMGTAGLNFETLRPRHEVMRDFRDVVAEVYRPGAYFARIRRSGRRIKPARFAEHKTHWPIVWRNALAFVRLGWTMTVRYPELADDFWGMMWECLRKYPHSLEIAARNSALYAHLYPYSRMLVATMDKRLAAMAEEEARLAQENDAIPARAMAMG